MIGFYPLPTHTHVYLLAMHDVKAPTRNAELGAKAVAEGAVNSLKNRQEGTRHPNHLKNIQGACKNAAN